MKNIIISLIIKYWNEILIEETTYNSYKYKDLAFEIANLSTMIEKLKIHNPKIALCAHNKFKWIVVFLTAIINDIPIVLMDPNFDKSIVKSYLNKSEANIFFTDRGKLIDLKRDLYVEAHVQMTSRGNRLILTQKPYATRIKLEEKWRALDKTDRGAIKKDLFKKFKNTVDKWSDTFTLTMYSSGVNGVPRKEVIHEPTIMRSHKAMVRKLVSLGLRRKRISIDGSFSVFAPITILPIIGVGGQISSGLYEPSKALMITTNNIEELWHYYTGFMGQKWQIRFERWWLTRWLNTIVLKKTFKQALGSEMKTIIILNDETFVRLKENLNRIGYKTVSTYGTTGTAQLISIDGQVIDGLGIKILSNDPSKSPGYLYTKEKLGKLDAYDYFLTGDIASIGPNSELIVHGRGDSRLTTLGGHVIYPEKIERIVNSFPLVKKSALAERFGEIVLFITFKADLLDSMKLTKGNAQIMAREIREELNDSLPDEINIDREVVIFDHFEVNSQGKLVREFFNTPPDLGN